MARSGEIRLRLSSGVRHEAHADRSQSLSRRCKDAVLAEWRGAKQTALSRDYLVELRKKYGVELDDGAKAMLGTEPAANVAAK